MARIVRKRTWFEQLSPLTFTEAYFEARITLHAPTIYPEYHVVPFKQTLYADGETASPDLAFISREYDQWIVVEVELSHHPLAHVERQVRVFSSAEYTLANANYLISKKPTLNRRRTRQLVTTEPPDILVIVNERAPNWESRLSNYGATVAIFELFRSARHSELFRIDGEYPQHIFDAVSDLNVHPISTNTWRVVDATQMQLPHNTEIALLYGQCITHWTRFDEGNNVYLRPVGRCPINNTYDHQVVRLRSGSLLLVPKNPK